MDTHVDQYGFLSQGSPCVEHVHRDNARLEKWTDMLQRWDFILRSRRNKLKARVRKGVPDCLRQKVWYDISGAEEIKAKYPQGHYQYLVSLPGKEDVEEQITKDLCRTFPTHILFQKLEGQNSLFRVLKAYSLFDPEVGYMQGMSFITAILLTYLNEEQAFWVLVSAIQRDDIRELYLPGMAGAHVVHYQVEELLKTFLPQLHSHFTSLHLTPILFCPTWFLTLCTHPFSVQSVVRIMDCFLSEGSKILFRITLSVLKIAQNRILQSDLPQTLALLKTLPSEIPTEKLIKRAFKFRLYRKTLRTLKTQYCKTSS